MRVSRRLCRHLGSIALGLCGLVAGGAGAAAVATAPGAPHYRLTVWPPRAASPDFELIDVDGRRRSLADYRGHVVVVVFGFLRCPDVCPAELFKFSQVMKQLGGTASRVQLLFVSLDPQRDTQPLLKSYVSSFDHRFVGLTGSNLQVDRAASAFHVEYARVPLGADYTIDHSTATFLIDASGRLRLVGTVNTRIDDYAHDLAALATE